MGEVYRARDTKLGRDVAIKVVPEEFARDKERLDRFEREARLLAQLNHPNIATLYGLEEHDRQRFLVMELVEGETLADRIAQGPISLDEAVPLFVQIAEGLEAAHEKGIIHRDLKPANLKIDQQGKPKILDFGLAKAFFPEENVSAETSQSPTLTKGTALGAIMGTAAYMSPEQAKGKALDRRTDNWSFGCCLYEALTGRRLFGGEDVSETLASVLRDEPRWDALPNDTPATLKTLLRRCLERDRHRRLQHIGDARLELQEPSPQAESDRPPVSRLRPIVAAAAIASILTGVAAWLVTGRAESPKPVPVQRLSIRIPDGDRFGVDQGIFGPSLALSPSGDVLVYVATRSGVQQLFHRPLDRDDPVPLPGTEGALQPFFSPDGASVGFFADGQLKTVSLDTGRVTILCSATESPMGGSWSSDGRIFFSPGPRLGMREVAETGGEPTPVPLGAEDELTWQNFPTLIPETDVLLYWETSTEGRNIVARNLRTGTRSVLISGLASRFPVYSSSGHLLVQRVPASVWAAPFDDKRLELGGAEKLLGDGGRFALAADGTLVFTPAPTGRSTMLTWVDRTGNRTVLAEASQFRYPRISPDGKWIVVSIGGDRAICGSSTSSGGTVRY